MTWTRFMDMYSGGSRKEAVEFVYIEAAEDAARSVFYSRYGHNPDRVTCTCCGADYSITEYPSLAEATANVRGVEVQPDGTETPGRYAFQRQERTLDEYRRDPNAAFIEAADIAPVELREAVPVQGYVWMGDDAGSADARLLAAMACLAAWAVLLLLGLWPVVVLWALLGLGLYVGLALTEQRRERAERAFLRSASRPGPVRPLTREQREAWERLRGQEWTT